jgi:hypothetical protein
MPITRISSAVQLSGSVLIGSDGAAVKYPYMLAQVASGWILPACAALSTVSQTGTTVTFTNAVATAHNIPASTYDGYQVYFPGSASIPAGWYSGFTRTSATQYTFTRATATVASESVNGGLAYTTDTTVATVSVPANSMGANGALRVHTTWGMNNNANTKNVNVKFDGSAIMGFGFASITAFSDLRYLRNRGVTNKQVGHPSGQGSLSSGTMTPVYLAVDTTAAKNITFTMSPATASDYVVLEGYSIEVIPL